MDIICLTPVAPGTVLAPYYLGLPRLISELAPVPGLCREANINMNRVRLQHLFSKLKHIYTHVLLMDSDVIIYSRDLDLLIQNWKPETTPCIRTKRGNTGHIVTSCALVGVTDYVKVKYLENVGQCQCNKLPHPFYIEGTEGKEVKDGRTTH